MAQIWAFKSAGAGSSTTTIALPATYSVGDVLILITTTYSGFNATPSTGNYSLIYESTGKLKVYYKIATASESSVTVSNASPQYGVILAYSNIVSSDVANSSTGTSASAANTNAVTTTQIDDLVLSIFTRTIGASTWGTTPTSTTQRFSFNSTVGFPGLFICDENQSAVGTTATRTITTSTSAAWCAGTVAFKQNSGNFFFNMM